MLVALAEEKVLLEADIWAKKRMLRRREPRERGYWPRSSKMGMNQACLRDRKNSSVVGIQ